MTTEFLQHQSRSFAWKAASFKSSADYSLKLSEAEQAEIVAAVRALPDNGRPHDAGADAFAMASLSPRLRAAYEDVRSGRGFVLIRGLPVDRLDKDEFVAAVWGIGRHFGNALSQNTSGDLIGHVVDATAEDATPRMYRSNLELRPHNDITAMISLACWHKSETGGASVIVSAVTVHEALCKDHPEVLASLYRGFHYHQVGEEAPGEPPVTRQRVPLFAVRNGQLSARYLRMPHLVSDAVARGMCDIGLEMMPTATVDETPAQFAKVVKRDHDRWGVYVRQAKIAPE